MRLKKIAPALILLALFIAAWAFELHQYFNFKTFKVHEEALEQFVDSNYVMALLIYAASYIAIVALSLPGATFMTLVGGFLFGQWVGTSVVVISATIGASLLFLIARRASADLLNRKTAGLATKMKQGFQENALSYLLTLRLIPLFPFVAVNLAAALFQIPLRTFVLGTFFGIMPGAFVYVAIGTAFREVIHQPDFSPSLMLDAKVLFAFTGLGALSLLHVLYKHLRQK